MSATQTQLPIGGREVARMFRLLECTGCQVGDSDDLVWYFQAGLVVRHTDAGFWLSVSPVRCESEPTREELFTDG